MKDGEEEINPLKFPQNADIKKYFNTWEKRKDHPCQSKAIGWINCMGYIKVRKKKETIHHSSLFLCVDIYFS